MQYFLIASNCIMLMLVAYLLHKRRKEAKVSALEKGQLKSIFDNLPGMIYRLNTDEFFTLRYISGNSKEYLGISNTEIAEQGLRPRDVIPKNYLEMIRSNIRSAFKSQKRGEVTFPIQINDSIKWLRTRFKPTSLNGGEQVIDGLLMDVTDQVENQERLSIAINISHMGMWDWYIEDQKVIVNTYQADMIGYSPNDVSTNVSWWTDKCHPDDRDKVNSAIIEHLKNKTEFLNSEYRIKTKDGIYKWLQLRAKVIERSTEGKAIRALGVHLDIDNQKKMEIALRKGQARMRALISNLPGMVYRCAVDNDMAITYVSEGSLALSGHVPEKFTKQGLTLFSMMKSAYRKEIKQQLLSAIEAGQPYDLIYELGTPNGNIWVSDKGQELESGYIEGFITNITERVKSEERVIATVIETQDRERQRISRELHDNLGQKLTTVSLNFNALKSLLPGADLKQRAEKGLGHLNAAIQDAREISHNLMPRSIEGFGFVPAVESLISEFNTLNPKINFEFYTNNEKKRFTESVELNLFRIVQEALTNVIKHAEANEVMIQLMHYKDSVVLTLEDDGKGFDLKSVSKENSFGLQSLRHRVQMLSGTIEMDSKPDHGTNISIELPVENTYKNE